MTAKQYRAAIERLGMTQGRAAEFLGVSPRTGQRYATEGGIPVAVDMLLTLMIALNLTPETVEEKAWKS
jgi:DNA-binding XRE family transcriptional regulator